MRADSVLNLPHDARMLDVVRQGLSTAQDVRVAVSFTRCSGLGLVLDPLKALAARGADVRVLTSTFQWVTQPEALDALHRLDGVQTRLHTGAEGFHGKFWWFGGAERTECWAGSSNLTHGGLSTNIEWNFRKEDAATLRASRAQFDELWTRHDVSPLTPELIARYRAAYRQRHRDDGQQHLLLAEAAPATVMPNMAQREALARLADLRARGGQRAAIVAAPGVGKTYLAAFDVHTSGAQSVLYVSHRLEHLEQARKSFARVLSRDRRLGLLGGGADQRKADVIFATIGTLARRPDVLARHFDYLIIDEFHHVEAPSYACLWPLRERAFLLGLTATPERQDGQEVLRWCDHVVAFEVRLGEAIDRGWLLPFHYYGIADESLDFLAVPWRRLDEVETALSIESRVDLVLRAALERGFDGVKRATIGFCAGRRHATFMARAFQARGQNAVAVLGDAPVDERTAVYDRLADPEDPLEWVFVSDILNEGVDIPAINSVLFLRPTESATLFLQQLGRGLRLFPGTEVLTVLDFVGHHRSAWVTLNALHAPSGAGRRQTVAAEVVLKPPRHCEIVLEARTRQILEKIERYTSRRELADGLYTDLREELGRRPLPIDLWDRADVPDLRPIRDAHGCWLELQRAHDDAPSWSVGLAADHPAFTLLRAIERDWQAQRVAPYALVWGLAERPEDPQAGYARFFERFPHWRVEQVDLGSTRTWETVRRKLGGALQGDRLDPRVVSALGDQLLKEVEGRLLYTVMSDYRTRHGGELRTPGELNLHASYRRPVILNHFGVQFDPVRHNTGVIWLDKACVLICKLDTSDAKAQHQYSNRLMDRETFLWTSQNKMSVGNAAGRRLLEHGAEGVELHLFVQLDSASAALYLGRVRAGDASGEGPMQVSLLLEHRVPEDVAAELGGGSRVGEPPARLPR